MTILSDLWWYDSTETSWHICLIRQAEYALTWAFGVFVGLVFFSDMFLHDSKTSVLVIYPFEKSCWKPDCTKNNENPVNPFPDSQELL